MNNEAQKAQTVTLSAEALAYIEALVSVDEFEHCSPEVASELSHVLSEVSE